MDQAQEKTYPENDAPRTQWRRGKLMEGFQKIGEAFAPPAAAEKHFREARLEVLRGLRELIDFQIDRLSKGNKQGTRIVVD